MIWYEINYMRSSYPQDWTCLESKLCMKKFDMFRLGFWRPERGENHFKVVPARWSIMAAPWSAFGGTTPSNGTAGGSCLRLSWAFVRIHAISWFDSWGRHIGRAGGADHKASNLAAPQSRMRRVSLRASNHLPVCFPTSILYTLT